MRIVPKLRVNPAEPPMAVIITPAIEMRMPIQETRLTVSRRSMTPMMITMIGWNEMSREPVPASTVFSPKLMPKL